MSAGPDRTAVFVTEAIDGLRKRYKITKADLDRGMGKGPGYWSRRYKGLCLTSLTDLFAAAAVLGVPADVIVALAVAMAGQNADAVRHEVHRCDRSRASSE